nr:unnamed protein product [Digitaria exilis]
MVSLPLSSATCSLAPISSCLPGVRGHGTGQFERAALRAHVSSISRRDDTEPESFERNGEQAGGRCAIQLQGTGEAQIAHTSSSSSSIHPSIDGGGGVDDDISGRPAWSELLPDLLGRIAACCAKPADRAIFLALRRAPPLPPGVLMRSTTAEDIVAVLTDSRSHPFVLSLPGKGAWTPEPFAPPFMYIIDVAFVGDDRLYGITRAEDLFSFRVALHDDLQIPVVTACTRVIRHTLDLPGQDYVPWSDVDDDQDNGGKCVSVCSYGQGTLDDDAIYFMDTGEVFDMGSGAISPALWCLDKFKPTWVFLQIFSCA